MKVKVNNIFNVSKEILIKANVPKEHAEQIANTIVYAHIREKHTHGLNRLAIYINKINAGMLDAQTPINIIRNSNATMLIDANNGFGQVATCYAIKEGIKKAKEYGVGLVGIRRSNNFGAAGFFGELACRENMIAMIISNSAPAIAPTGGKKAIFGTSPICIAFPGKENIILDMATSVVARGKIRNAVKNGKKIPTNWALDSEGQPTDDPSKAIEGTMLPIGGYKGAGLSLCFDILAGLLMGAGYAGNTRGLNDFSDISNYGHFVLIIDVEKFICKEDYNNKYDFLLKTIKNDNGIYPGQLSNYKALKNQEFVDIPDNQYYGTMNLCEKLQTMNKL